MLKRSIAQDFALWSGMAGGGAAAAVVDGWNGFAGWLVSYGIVALLLYAGGPFGRLRAASRRFLDAPSNEAASDSQIARALDWIAGAGWIIGLASIALALAVPA